MKVIISLICSLLAIVSAEPTAYQTNLEYINNVRRSGSRWELDINKFVTLPHKTFSKMFKGYSMTYDPNRVSSFPGGSGVPDSYDWRDHDGIVGAVKNQEQCGSCWAFSAVGALESQIAKVTGTPVVLSEQEMVDCVKNVMAPDNSSSCCDGCMGGEMYSVYQYLIENNSEDDTEKQYPYKAVDQDCQAVTSKVKTKLKSFVSLPIGDEDSIKSALYNHGPISVGVNANEDWQLYSKGIYNPSENACDSSTTSMDHGVILVGYGSEDGLDYWIVRNSWGDDWGEKGYMRLGRGHNACGVANAAIYPVLKTSLVKDSTITGQYCGDVLGIVRNINITFNTNSTFDISADVFNKPVKCINEKYSYDKTSGKIVLTEKTGCISEYLSQFGVSDLEIAYSTDAIRVSVDGETFSLSKCTSIALDACHDNCGNSCSSGPCGSCSNLCCGCGCNTCKCCHEMMFD